MSATARLRDYLALTKPGITQHVLVTVAAGYYLAVSGPADWGAVAALLAGTALVSGGTNGLNQWWEHSADALMRRTRHRPVASGRIRPAAALTFSLGIGVLGVALLATGTNALTAALAALTLASYVLVYTPLKLRTSLNTLAGCVPGALPILGGWTAATGRLDAGGLALFAVLYLWQIPHTLALTWMHRADYRRGGFLMPGMNDEAGGRTARQAMVASGALVAASMLLAWLAAPLPAVAAAGAAVLGGLLLFSSAAWVLRPATVTARRLFLATLAYLPGFLVVLAVTKAVA